MAKKKKKRSPFVPVSAPTPFKKPKEVLPWLFWVVLGLGVLIKSLHLYFSQGSPFYEPLLLDPEYYHHWALRITGGDWVGEGVFHGLPLYPYFLALGYKVFGQSILAVKIVQAFLGLVTLFFIYKIGEKLASQKAGLIAAALAAFYGPLFFHETIFIPEVLSVPLYAAAFYMGLLFLEGPSVKKGAALGVLLGLSALTKAGIILFVFLFLAALFIREIRSRGRQFLPVLACLAAFLAALAPVTAHNLIYGKDRVLLTAHGGINFYIGNNPKAEGVFAAPEGVGTNVETQIQDSREVAERELGRDLKPSEVSQYWMDKAWDFIRENPGQFLRLCFVKFVLFFDAREISDVEDYVFAGNFNPLLRFPWLNFAVLGPLFLVGLAASFRDLKHRSFVYFWTLSYVFGVVAFFVNARYRLPLLSVFIPVAAIGLVHVYERLRERSVGKLFFYALVLLAGIGLTQAHFAGTDWSRDYANAGDVYFKKKDYDEAVRFYKKALEIDPRYSRASQAMGIVLTQLGRYEEAKDYFIKSVELTPTSASAHNSLGLAYDREGNLEEAKRCFLKAIELKPNLSQAHNNLGMVYGKMGENEKAIQEFEIALKLNPNSARAYTNLGLIVYRLGRVDEAKELWQKALRIDPQFEEARRALSLLQQ